MADIGSTLRETRMRARIDITEVERATKIRARYLRAIENEEFDALPGPVYVKSFLRTYADYLGLDAHVLVDEYKRRYEGSLDYEPRPVNHARRERERDRGPRGPLLPPWALIGIVLVGIVAALYVIGSLPNHSTPTKTQAPAALRPAKRHVVRHRARPRPVAPTTVTLQIVPTGPVYVCLVNGAGRPLIPGQIFTPGQAVPTERSSKLMLTLGNNAVHVKVNGKPLNIAPSATPIGFELTPKAATPLPAGQQPRCT